MPAGKIKESLWLGTARIFLSSLRGQGGVRQLDGALGGLWGLGRPPKPKRPRVQVPAESNQGEIWECHSCSQRRCSAAQLLSPPRRSASPLSHFFFSPSPPPFFCCRLTDTHVIKKRERERDCIVSLPPEVHQARSSSRQIYVYACVCVCVASCCCTLISACVFEYVFKFQTENSGMPEVS